MAAVSQFPLNIPVNPDGNVYATALLLSLASGLLFGAVPVKQVLRTDAYQIIKSGTTGTVGRRLTVRDLLLGVQVAICAVLVTSSIVAVRGLATLAAQRLRLRAAQRHAGRYRSGYGRLPRRCRGGNAEAHDRCHGGDSWSIVGSAGQHSAVTSMAAVTHSNVFTDETTDLRPSTAAAHAEMFSISPEYFHAAGTPCWRAETFTWHDDKNAPRVAVINQEFARRIFGSVTNAMGRYYKMPDGKRIQVVGIAEDGKYSRISPNLCRRRCSSPFCNPHRRETFVVVRSKRRPAATRGSHTNQTAGPGLRAASFSNHGTRQWTRSVSRPVWPRCRWVCWA